MTDTSMPDTSTIEGLLAAWIAAFNSHDLTAHAELYTPDAMLFGAVPDLAVGREAIRAYFAGRGPAVHVAHYPRPHAVAVAPDVVVTAAQVDFADGPTPMPYRVTWVLVRRDGRWRIAQHHGSPRRPA